jgi:hypothetical protein
MVGFIYAYFSNLRTFERIAWLLFLLFIIAGRAVTLPFPCPTAGSHLEFR